MPVPTRIVTVPHRFISGEGGALVRGINGEAHIPPGRKVRSSDNGVMGCPRCCPTPRRSPSSRSRPARAVGVQRGRRPEEPGTVILTVGGSATSPAVVECPTGTPLAKILAMCGADVGPGVLVGGYHGKWITADAAMSVTVSRKGFRGGRRHVRRRHVLPIGARTCPLGEVAQVTQYLAGESAGQCGPCRLGLPDLARASRWSRWAAVRSIMYGRRPAS
jgi:NADH:ubiquinone oxidoreductase subunit F (NADH-binding)